MSYLCGLLFKKRRKTSPADIELFDTDSLIRSPTISNILAGSVGLVSQPVGWNGIG